MRCVWIAALCGILAACAGATVPVALDCRLDQSYERGRTDAAAGRTLDFAFVRACSAGSRVDSLAAYRDGFAAVKPVKQERDTSHEAGAESSSPKSVPVLMSVQREPATIAWLCEVEANSKVFTGVGSTREDALGSARSTCGSHFQASYCNKADCKQNL